MLTSKNTEEANWANLGDKDCRCECAIDKPAHTIPGKSRLWHGLYSGSQESLLTVRLLKILLLKSELPADTATTPSNRAIRMRPMHSTAECCRLDDVAQKISRTKQYKVKTNRAQTRAQTVLSAISNKGLSPTCGNEELSLHWKPHCASVTIFSMHLCLS